MKRATLVAVLWLGLGASAQAAQIVALDLRPAGGVSPSLTAALNPLVITALSRRDGMSVVAQSDVRALLELDANKQALGCDDTTCMTDIADSLGAELLVASTLSKVGKKYVVTMTLIQVDGAKVLRRSVGEARGGESVASTAVESAVHNLFAKGLPREVQGPASLSRRGFKAALAGLRKSYLERGGDRQASRRRVVLDLVNTELDYDARPKIDMLDLEIRRGAAEAEKRAWGAKDAREFEHYMQAWEAYGALRDDWGRVKEIRERARERGLKPSAYALRFEDPEPFERPSRADFDRYWKRSKDARDVVKRALRAYRRGDVKTFAGLWRDGARAKAERALRSGQSSDARYHYSYRLLPAHAFTPRVAQRAMNATDAEKAAVILLREKDGAPSSTRTVRLVLEHRTWRIDSW